MKTLILLTKLIAHLYTLYSYASMYFIRWSKMILNIVGKFVTLGLQLDKHTVCNCSSALQIQ